MRGLPSLDTQHTCVSPHRVAPRHRAQLHTAVPRRAHPAWHARNHLRPTHTLVHRVHRPARWNAETLFTHDVSDGHFYHLYLRHRHPHHRHPHHRLRCHLPRPHLHTAPALGCTRLGSPLGSLDSPFSSHLCSPLCSPLCSARTARPQCRGAHSRPSRRSGRRACCHAAAAQDHLASTSPLSDIEDAIPLPAASGYGIDAPNAQGVAPVPD